MGEINDFTISYGYNFIEEYIPNVQNQNHPSIVIENLKSELIKNQNDLFSLSNQCNEIIEKYHEVEDFDYATYMLHDITFKISIDFIDIALEML